MTYIISLLFWSDKSSKFKFELLELGSELLGLGSESLELEYELL